MKRIIAIAFCLSSGLFVSAQLSKVAPHNGSLIVDFSQKKLVKPYLVTERRPFTTSGPQIKAPSAFAMEDLTNAIHGPQYLSYNDDGMPKAFEQSHVLVPRDRDQSSYFAEYLIKSLNLSSSHSFILTNAEKDVTGTNHYKFQQTYHGIPVINGEYTLHQYVDQHVYACGYAWNLADINTKVSISENEATNEAKKHLASKSINFADQKINSAVRTGVKLNRLCIYKDASSAKWVTAYQIQIIPNLKENWELFVDAQNGKIIDAHTNICRIAHDHTDEFCAIAPTGAETASALDLSNNTRTINVWKEGATYYLIDASRPMFQASRSKFPDNPVGVLITYDFKNRNVETTNSADYVTSTNNSWSSKTSVSAHLNGAAAYEYYRQTHGRNSIDGTGGTIISVINVQDGGGAMDNAFWNGEAMFYGNGSRAFTPLAKGLDVAGHEMSHGVIGSTANLAYQSESGAINESFADVFGAMIDRDDWKIGEDVVITSVFRSGALRDLSDPHNGGSSLNDNGYQPRHVNEQYKGTEDNGGVHINSGIPNYAFYIFVTEMAKSRSLEEAKKIGEKVYYYALTKLLTRSSNFKDLRAAIEKSCTDLYNNTPDVLASAKTGFDRVGIGSSGGNGGSTGNRILKTNPGQEYIVCTDENQNGLY
ncbi:MAG TPA: M4 family metallopeptidase, partial [Saprospiraceae bacterium]|nr:M4 family metallopeptidase [Saprospiraceae bacterium]